MRNEPINSPKDMQEASGYILVPIERNQKSQMSIQKQVVAKQNDPEDEVAMNAQQTSKKLLYKL